MVWRVVKVWRVVEVKKIARSVGIGGAEKAAGLRGERPALQGADTFAI
jgi:hypothetical protein